MEIAFVRAPKPSLVTLIAGLARLSIVSFGGIAPQARHFFVVRMRWIDDDEFAELLTLGQALPGANIVNVVSMLGDRWYGPLGSTAAIAALIVPPLIAIVIAASLIAHIPPSPRLVTIESAIVFASAGLVFANGYRILAQLLARKAAFALGIAVAIAVAAYGTWMPEITLGALVIGFGFAYSGRRA